ncbi:NmrA family NAD(P)-binding protein [Mucilaginibacter flavus]|uniref:NmrA family NAD(P)-binding protein n=1 Tax=Mucilaginibacter flavus TaxID=931504 RepID=UPI0025B61BC0|nr:NmrA family NAD(P)-binding protein [Mucilaginibacter flavus]MDN3579641.1 NmrA family NAD(P)-binding protein [Mucilaginibacter flavus]
MKVIVTGSLGNIGKPLATALVAKGHNVTVISSNPEKQKDIEALGAAAAIGSLEDTAFLAATFAGADALFAMEPPNYAAPDTRAAYRTIGENYAQVIPQSGIKRVVHLSSYGAHLAEGTGFILGVHDVEGILNKLQGIAITHLRPAYFYYNLYNFANMIKQAGFIGTNYGGDDKLTMVAPSDIAVAAAEELTQPATTGNNVRYVASDDITGHEAARILGEAIGKPDLKWVIFTDEQTQAAMEQNGVPANIAALYVELGAAIHNGKLREDYDLNKPTVMGKVKLTDFAKEFAAAFLKI